MNVSMISLDDLVSFSPYSCAFFAMDNKLIRAMIFSLFYNVSFC